MTMSVPLLSICIPTYNRANLLAAALRALVPQVRALAGDVELVVCDNCSPDDTTAVVEDAQRRWGPIRYYRNETNVGMARNILRVTNELAVGEFGWVVGDDDVMLPGGVARVVEALKSCPETDHLFANAAAAASDQREALERGGFAASDIKSLLTVGGEKQDYRDRQLQSWDELIDPHIDSVCLGALMCSVFRLSLWRQCKLEIPNSGDVLVSLDGAYPHSVIFANVMPGRNAYYVEHPCLITYWGTQEWMGRLPMMQLVHLQALLDLYIKNGARLEQVERCRHALLSNSPEHLRLMLYCRHTPDRCCFSLGRFLWQNRRHPRMLGRVCRMAMGKQVVQGLIMPSRRWFLARLPGPARAVVHRMEQGLGWRWRALKARFAHRW